jgi:hypothetical protein
VRVFACSSLRTSGRNRPPSLPPPHVASKADSDVELLAKAAFAFESMSELPNMGWGLGVNYTCVFDVQIECAENRPLHLNAD